MTSVADLRMIKMWDLVWPMTIRYHISAPWGMSQITLSVDVPEFHDQPASSLLLGRELWDRSIASAMTRDVMLEIVETWTWRMGWGSFVAPQTNVRGGQIAPAAPRRDSGCLVLHTGHSDNYARRRLILPGIPRSWAHDGLLTDGARGALETMAQFMVMGMCGHLNGAPMIWLNHYPDVDKGDPTNPFGVAFRRVEFVRVCWHTDRAPDPSMAL